MFNKEKVSQLNWHPQIVVCDHNQGKERGSGSFLSEHIVNLAQTLLIY